jgi:elongation factor G
MLPFVLPPDLSYRQTPRTKGIGAAKIARAVQGHGQYGHVELSVEPLSRGAGFEFSHTTVADGAVPPRFFYAIETGALRAARTGLWGFPLANFRVCILDGSYHEVDSTEDILKEVAESAFIAAMSDSNPFLLEPRTTLTVSLSEQYKGVVLGILNAYRAFIVDAERSPNRVTAKVPLSETSAFLRSLSAQTEGSATFSATEPDFSTEVPDSLTRRCFCHTCYRDMIIPLIQDRPLVESCLVCRSPFEPPDLARFVWTT